MYTEVYHTNVTLPCVHINVPGGQHMKPRDYETVVNYEWLREGTVRSTVMHSPLSYYICQFILFRDTSSCLIYIQQCCDAVQWLDDKWREYRFPVFTTIPRDGRSLCRSTLVTNNITSGTYL